MDPRLAKVDAEHRKEITSLMDQMIAQSAPLPPAAEVDPRPTIYLAGGEAVQVWRVDAKERLRSGEAFLTLEEALAAPGDSEPPAAPPPQPAPKPRAPEPPDPNADLKAAAAAVKPAVSVEEDPAPAEQPEEPPEEPAESTPPAAAKPASLKELKARWKKANPGKTHPPRAGAKWFAEALAE